MGVFDANLLEPAGPATWHIRPGAVGMALSEKPIRVIGTEAILETFDEAVLKQALATRLAPGVTDLVLNPDAHVGYGAPIGCVAASPTHIYPGPVGVDISCSMSLLQFDLPGGAIREKRLRRALIDEIAARLPFGPGKGRRHVPKSRNLPMETLRDAMIHGASKPAVLDAMGVSRGWAGRCERAGHDGHDGSHESLARRLSLLLEGGGKRFPKFEEKAGQLGSYGGGNHFGECEIVEVAEGMEPLAREFGLRDGHVAFLSHCGSRGVGYTLATGQFRDMEHRFRSLNIPFPGDDKQLVYAELGTPEADAYLDDMALGANFAIGNHLLINSLIAEAFEAAIPGLRARFVYLISHNIASRERVAGRWTWVHRKGATRAFPAGHPGLRGTPFFRTGHPILLPGNPLGGSSVMVAREGAADTLYSINHGAGRAMGRKQAERTLDKKTVNAEFAAANVLSNARDYPLDEAPAAYKDFREVLRSVELAGLAAEVARLHATFVMKDADKSWNGAA